MNYKTIISFLIFAVISIVAYLTISTIFDLSQERRNYGVTVLSPSVSFKNVKNYQPGNHVTTPSYQHNNIISTPKGSSPGVLSNSQTLGVTTTNIDSKIYNTDQKNGSITGGSYLKSTTSSNGNGNIAGQMMPSIHSGGRNNRSTAGSASGMIALKETKSSASPTYEPFSGGGTAGLPDPGGNADDSCEDDIVFLPVSDGLPFLIFLTLIYILIKIFRDKITSQRLYAKTSYTSSGLKTKRGNG